MKPGQIAQSVKCSLAKARVVVSSPDYHTSAGNAMWGDCASGQLAVKGVSRRSTRGGSQGIYIMFAFTM